jgi:alpha-mannosidase
MGPCWTNRGSAAIVENRMKYEELIILLPCHSLEDFPLYHEKEAAEGLLSAWTAMWHPALLADCGKTPTWARADSPPEKLAGRLLIVPQVSESLLQAGWAARAQSEGGHVVRKTAQRDEILKSALGALDQPPADEPPLAGDFLALGLCFLQVELLTRQMRYMSNLDEKHFQRCVLTAARASMAGDADAARGGLQSCFDVLMEARERFYPAQAYLLDITLAAPTTLGQALRNELARPTPRSLLVSADTVAEMAAREAATLEALRAALEHGTLTLVGGEAREQELPLLPVESILAGLRAGVAEYQRYLGAAPLIFGRRRFGLSPVLPQILSRCGFRGAVHFTLDEGQFPREGQSKTRWEGFDSSAIDALTRVPLDADLPESFLSFPQKMGETMDLDHVAVVGFAHWPGQYRPWFDDLRRIASYAPVLGRFATIAEFLSATDASGYLSKFTADQYRAPYLKQAVIRRQADPLSRCVDHYRRRAAADAANSVGLLAALLSGDSPGLPPHSTDDAASALAADSPAVDLDQRLSDAIDSAARRLSAALPRASAAAAQGLLIVNPLSFARRANIALPDSVATPEAEGAVAVVQETAGGRYASVDLPAMGFAWLGAVNHAAARKRKGAEKPLAEDNLLRNDFCEVVIDPRSGGIRSVHDYKHRGNRLSQQLGFRLPGPRPKPGDVWRDPDDEVQYAGMIAETIEIVSAGPVLGEIVSRGHLADGDGRRLANFEQRVRVWRGSPVISLRIQLDPLEEPRADPWNSYFASRFAWADETADLFRGVNQATQPTEAKKLEAPLFVELRAEKFRTTILTGGLPYHRRVGLRMLDSLLVVRGQQGRVFQMGIGLDLPYPQANAWELLTPPVVLAETAPPPLAATGWFCHVDLRNILATHWAPLVEQGAVVGFNVRLLETEGRPGRARLRVFRPIASARQVDFRGETLAALVLEDGAAIIDFTAHEWVQIEARFA